MTNKSTAIWVQVFFTKTPRIGSDPQSAIIMYAYEDEDATAAALRRGTPVPWSRMFSDVKTSVPVNQVALMTSLQTHFGCSLTGRTDRGDDIADLLEDAIDFMDPLKYGDLWSKTPL